MSADQILNSSCQCNQQALASKGANLPLRSQSAIVPRQQLEITSFSRNDLTYKPKDYLVERIKELSRPFLLRYSDTNLKETKLDGGTCQAIIRSGAEYMNYYSDSKALLKKANEQASLRVLKQPGWLISHVTQNASSVKEVKERVKLFQKIMKQEITRVYGPLSSARNNQEIQRIAIELLTLVGDKKYTSNILPLLKDATLESQWKAASAYLKNTPTCCNNDIIEGAYTNLTLRRQRPNDIAQKTAKNLIEAIALSQDRSKEQFLTTVLIRDKDTMYDSSAVVASNTLWQWLKNDGLAEETIVRLDQHLRNNLNELKYTQTKSHKQLLEAVYFMDISKEKK